MNAVTISYRYLSLSLDENDTVTLARTDRPGSIQISVSEWNWLQRVIESVQTPIHPPIEPSND